MTATRTAKKTRNAAADKGPRPIVNKHKGTCGSCGSLVGVGEGMAHPTTNANGQTKWTVRHNDGECPEAPATASVETASAPKIRPAKKESVTVAARTRTARTAAPAVKAAAKRASASASRPSKKLPQIAQSELHKMTITQLRELAAQYGLEERKLKNGILAELSDKGLIISESIPKKETVTVPTPKKTAARSASASKPAPKPQPAPEPEEEELTEDDLKAMSLAELLEVAEDNEIDVPTAIRKRKTAVLSLILDAMGEDEEEDETDEDEEEPQESASASDEEEPQDDEEDQSAEDAVKGLADMIRRGDFDAFLDILDGAISDRIADHEKQQAAAKKKTTPAPAKRTSTTRSPQITPAGKGSASASGGLKRNQTYTVTGTRYDGASVRFLGMSPEKPNLARVKLLTAAGGKDVESVIALAPARLSK